MPNRFWPDTTSAESTGNAIQQNTTANNPDVYCESQGSGYRLPSSGEYLSSARLTNPWASSKAVTPRHWSAYESNDIQKSALPNIAGRVVSGSLLNEWGDLSLYGQGWAPRTEPLYWTTEPSRIDSVSNQYRQYIGISRFVANIATGEVGPPTTNVGYYNPGVAPLLAGDLRSVACVRDLVPTPSTPVPGKS